MVTYQTGMAVVVAVILSMLYAIAVLDILCYWRGWPSIGFRVQQWSKQNAWFVAGLLLLFGAFLGHFFGHLPPKS